jgi:hypothetical protein
MGDCDIGGPLNDYVAVTAKDNFTDGWERYYCIYATNNDQRHQNTFVGPFKIPDLTMNSGGNPGNTDHGKRVAGWTLQYTLSYWSDGASNQICFAEKFIPRWAYNEPYSQTTKPGLYWDGGFPALYLGGSVANTARIASDNIDMISQSPDNPKRTKESGNLSPVDDDSRGRGGKEQFGSCHTATLNVLIGDGSVRTLPVTVLPRVFTSLSIVNDGNVVSLP